MGSGKPETTKKTILTTQALDLDKLAYAVSCAETACGKDGTARKRNNLHGIMCWKNKKRYPCYFSSPEASTQRFKEIWAKSYKVFPTMKEARRWTGNDSPERWLQAVNQYFNQ